MSLCDVFGAGRSSSICSLEAAVRAGFCQVAYSCAGMRLPCHGQDAPNLQEFCDRLTFFFRSFYHCFPIVCGWLSGKRCRELGWRRIGTTRSSRLWSALFLSPRSMRRRPAQGVVLSIASAAPLITLLLYNGTTVVARNSICSLLKFQNIDSSRY